MRSRCKPLITGRRHDCDTSKHHVITQLQASLVAVGAFVLADDITGFGVADDVVLPYLALAALWPRWRPTLRPAARR